MIRKIVKALLKLEVELNILKAKRSTKRAQASFKAAQHWEREAHRLQILAQKTAKRHRSEGLDHACESTALAQHYEATRGLIAKL